MQDEILKVDGREVVIRPMDDAHIISECAHQRTEGRSSRMFRRFHAEIRRLYGNAGIVALCGGKIVGYVNFYPAFFSDQNALTMHKYFFLFPKKERSKEKRLLL